MPVAAEKMKAGMSTQSIMKIFFMFLAFDITPQSSHISKEQDDNICKETKCHRRFRMRDNDTGVIPK